MKATLSTVIVVLIATVLLSSCATRGKKDGGNPAIPATIPNQVRLKREGNRVWIDGAKALFHKHMEDSKTGRATPWAERGDTHMYLTRMWIAGWNVDYATLNTVSGHGPSFSYCSGADRNDYINYLPPAGRNERIAHATGCKHVWRRYRDIEDYWQALKRTINEGHAVQAPNEEDLLFIGYEEGGKPEDRRVMPVASVFVDEDEWTWEQFKKWFAKPMVNGWFGRIEGRVEPWPARRSAIEVMRMMVAVANGEDSRRKPNDGVHWGIKGIEVYAADLADMSKSGGSGPGGYFGGGWRGCHCVYPQASGRPAAAAYLKSIFPLFEGQVSRQIQAAASEYDKATECWRDYFAQLGRDGERTVDVDHTTAWTTAQYRQAGAAAVHKAHMHERKAIDALAKAINIYENAEHLSTSDSE